MLNKNNVGILLFNEVEVLDFAGPFEVFSCSSFTVKTVAQSKELISAYNGLKIQPDYDFNDAPNFDILIIPGGIGASDIEINNQTVINWIKAQAKNVKLIASVCTGVFLLAQAGIIKDNKVTTHWAYIDRLEKQYSNIQVQHNIKYVDEGSIITSAGISAGINMSLHIVKRFVGEEIAKNTAKMMEYEMYI